jgi:aspartate/methionine/tyrosine aminotransferase
MTGWRIGYIHANPELVSVIVKVHQHINTNTAAFIQKAAVAALTGPQDHLKQFIENLRQRRALYEEMLIGNERLTGSHPDGGFFALLNISVTGLSSDEFCTRLLEQTGVAVIPGVSFGADFDDYSRISLVNHTEVVSDGLNRISDFVDRTARCK